jgi:hypothetical protein
VNVQRFRDDLRYRLDGLRLHPKRRQIVGGAIAGALGLAAFGMLAFSFLSAPAQPRALKPLAMLTEAPDAAPARAEMQTLSGIALSPGWRLVAKRSEPVAVGDGAADSRVWVFMTEKPDAPARTAEAKALAPKGGDAVPAAAMCEGIALEFGRSSVGIPIMGWLATPWNAGDGDVRLEVLETNGPALARVQWVSKKRIAPAPPAP